MYSPEFSKFAAVSIRRFAWAMNTNMKIAVDIMTQSLPDFIDSEKVCFKCRDKTKCTSCTFKNSRGLPEKL